MSVSQKQEAEVTKCVKWFRETYGNISLSRGRRHTYLGMDLNFTVKGKCRITMPSYTCEINAIII